MGRCATRVGARAGRDGAGRGVAGRGVPDVERDCVDGHAVLRDDVHALRGVAHVPHLLTTHMHDRGGSGGGGTGGGGNFTCRDSKRKRIRRAISLSIPLSPPSYTHRNHHRNSFALVGSLPLSHSLALAKPTDLDDSVGVGRHDLGAGVVEGRRAHRVVVSVERLHAQSAPADRQTSKQADKQTSRQAGKRARHARAKRQWRQSRQTQRGTPRHARGRVGRERVGRLGSVKAGVFIVRCCRISARAYQSHGAPNPPCPVQSRPATTVPSPYPTVPYRASHTESVLSAEAERSVEE